MAQGLFFVFLGYFLWVLHFLFYLWEVRVGITPLRRRFTSQVPANGIPGPTDYLSTTMGNLVCLPLMDFSVGVIAQRYPNEVTIAPIIVLSILAILGAVVVRLGVFKVKLTPAQFFHIGYFSYQNLIGLLGLWLILVLRVGWPIFPLLGFGGAAAYSVTVWVDGAKGRFNPLNQAPRSRKER